MSENIAWPTLAAVQKLIGKTAAAREIGPGVYVSSNNETAVQKAALLSFLLPGRAAALIPAEKGKKPIIRLNHRCVPDGEGGYLRGESQTMTRGDIEAAVGYKLNSDKLESYSQASERSKPAIRKAAARSKATKAA